MNEFSHTHKRINDPADELTKSEWNHGAYCPFHFCHFPPSFNPDMYLHCTLLIAGRTGAPALHPSSRRYRNEQRGIDDPPRDSRRRGAATTKLAAATHGLYRKRQMLNSHSLTPQQAPARSSSAASAVQQQQLIRPPIIIIITRTLAEEGALEGESIIMIISRVRSSGE